MWKYSEILMDHFMNPRNAGELDNPDGHSEVGSPQCGDAMTLDIKVDDDDRISDIRFMTFGCAGAIAAASALTEIAKGLTLEEAKGIKNSQIVKFLGGMPAEKYHCSVMGHDALSDAINNFITKRDAIAVAIKDILAENPGKLRSILGDRTIRIEHVHPGRIRISNVDANRQKVTEILEKELHDRTGSTVEVRID
ncbi:MAG: iron-sulfur cluster assembly scaffold protein [Candidatus Aegiribacteria sp.]|nr:iron-sulfur cluster assembly scaffold protein [Candidatus Aegiribacteria sp.]